MEQMELHNLFLISSASKKLGANASRGAGAYRRAPPRADGLLHLS